MEHEVSQEHAITHEAFYTEVLSGRVGMVKKVGHGQDGACQVSFGSGLKATLKPKLFSTVSKHGISANSQYLREAAAYQYDRQLLGFNLVPPTTLTIYQARPASIQAWMQGVPARALAPQLFDRDATDRKGQAALLAAKVNTGALRRLVILDLLTNNTDRHGRNALFDTLGHTVWAIDNGCAFGRFMEGYYNVFHRLLWPKNLLLTDAERDTIGAITEARLQTALGRYLSAADIKMAALRVRWLLMQPNLGYMALMGSKTSLSGWRAWFLQELRGDVPSEFTLAIRRMGQTA